MAKPWTLIDATLAGPFAERGYGQGTGREYKPWLDKEKVWVLRPVTSLKGWTTGRVHYLVGELAHPYFYLVEWSESVLDIREQYPLLPLEETLAIAKGLGIRHPVHGQTRKPIVLVTDFLLMVQQEGKSVQQARALASVASLEDQRGIETAGGGATLLGGSWHRLGDHNRARNPRRVRAQCRLPAWAHNQRPLLLPVRGSPQDPA